MEEQRKNTLIYVLSKDGKPLMPIKKPAKVRRWLRDGKAKVIRKCPFTIKLLFETKGECLQNVTLGVDTGSKHIGVACVSNNKVLYQSQVELRDDIKTKMDNRKMYRKNRRYKKTRYRKPRFLNRANSKREDRLPPSVKHKVQAHIDEIEFCKKILPVNKMVFEVSQFDTHLLKNPSLINEKIKHWGYQKGFNYGFSSRKEAVLNRDGYKCQNCGKKNCRLDIETFGFVTKENRNYLNLSKTHYIDACVIASGGKEFKLNDYIFYKKRVSKQNRSMRKGVRGEQNIPLGKVHGFKKFDKVKYLDEEYFVKGRRTSGFFVLMDIFGKNIDFRDRGGRQNPSYKLLKRIKSRTSCLINMEKVIPVLS